MSGRTIFDRWRTPAALLIACLGVAGAAAADDPVTEKPPSPPANKLTLAYYHFSSGVSGEDINIRHTFASGSVFASSTAWLGGYRESDGFRQFRLGYEYDYHHGWLTFVPSAQVATHGFVGGTLYSEIGQPFFGIVGYGRTNLQPYWNLGFDPNDYIQFGAGYRDRSGNTVLVSAIRDIRNGTGQTNTHVVFRHFFGNWRLTLDAVHEQGEGDDGLVVKDWAANVDIDWRRWFVRVAEDPHVNYTPDSQVRVAAGIRF